MSDQPAPPAEPHSRLLAIPEVARASGLSDTSIRRAIERGDLRAMKICNRIRIAREDMEAWHARSAVMAQPEHVRIVAPDVTSIAHRRTRRSPDPVPGGFREMLGNTREDPAA